jgi:SAM-dependent methyltransferase
MDAPEAVDTSNFAKHQTRNPVVRRLISRFYRRLREIVAPLEAQAVLDAGCGEGEAIARLGHVLPSRVFAIDILEESVAYTRGRLPHVEVSRESIYALPFDDDCFDLVLCLEVLEHLGQPAAALAELSRVGRRDLVVSVPFEPYFQIGSLLRGKYVTRAGNHPEHVNHWNRRTLPGFLAQQATVRQVAVAFPWLIDPYPVR